MLNAEFNIVGYLGKKNTAQNLPYFELNNLKISKQLIQHCGITYKPICFAYILPACTQLASHDPLQYKQISAVYKTCSYFSSAALNSATNRLIFRTKTSESNRSAYCNLSIVASFPITHNYQTASCCLRCLCSVFL
jgi:hypothetical protein